HSCGCQRWRVHPRLGKTVPFFFAHKLIPCPPPRQPGAPAVEAGAPKGSAGGFASSSSPSLPPSRREHGICNVGVLSPPRRPSDPVAPAPVSETVCGSFAASSRYLL